MGFAYDDGGLFMPKSGGEPKRIEADMASSNTEEQEQADTTARRPEDEPVEEQPVVGAESVQSDDWWSAQPPVADWATPAEEAPAEDVHPSKEVGMADVYFCGHTSLFPLNRALQAIANEKLTGSLRSFWEHEPIDLLARNGEIVLVTTRDPDLYSPETSPLLTDVDVVVIARARALQSENGMPIFLTLAREESIDMGTATESMQSCGQKLFSQLWTSPRVWIMFEKKADLLGDVEDLPGEPNVSDWALETLRLVENFDQMEHFDPTSIPAYTKEGFERVQKLKLSSDEAQFASQFNGARSVQQIAKNLRLDLKSAQQLLFRFLALEIVECWPASTAAKPEQQNIFQRFGRLGRRNR
jgi:hypothetical protein